MQATEVYTIPQRLNNVPASRETRKFFYNDVCTAVKSAVAADERLLSVRCAYVSRKPREEAEIIRWGGLCSIPWQPSWPHGNTCVLHVMIRH